MEVKSTVFLKKGEKNDRIYIERQKKIKGGNTMNIDKLYLNMKAQGFDTLVCQTQVQTEKDKEKYAAEGYNILFTEYEFTKEFSIAPSLIYYSPSVANNCFYFNKETLAVCPFNIALYELSKISPKEESRKIFDKEKAYEILDETEKEIADGKFEKTIYFLPDAMKLEYIDMIIKKGIHVKNLYSLFYYAYTSSDYGFAKIDPATVKEIFSKKTKSDKEKTKKAVANFPDILTVYRGENSASTPYTQSFSWTLDENIANFFAIRRGLGPGRVIKAEIKKEDIMECIDVSMEKEIIVDPENVEVIEIRELVGKDDLYDILPKVVDTYNKYKEKLTNLNFVIDSKIHGEEHELRVLLYCLILADMLNLPSSDKKILALAAIYHDTRRTNDYKDPEHGKSAKDYYISDCEKPDPIVSFLCEYHSLPDEAGFAEIQNSRKLSKNRRKTELLYKIFKDADALDRVRLGDIAREMDLKQFRLPESKSLTLAARICFQNIKM